MASGEVATIGGVGGMDSAQNMTRGTQHPLSCTHCRHRKVKCDKVYPCLHCQRSNLTCVFPERARHLKKKRDGPKASNDDLLYRLRRMEELIGKMEAGKGEAAHKSTSLPGQEPLLEGQSRSMQPSRSSSIAYESLDDPEDGLNRYIGHGFLRSLTMEVEGLRQSMDDDSDEEESTQKSSSDAVTPQSAAVFSSTLSAPKDLRLLHPSPAQISQLCTLFIENVDPMFKLLHIPSLRDMVSDAISNMDGLPSGTFVEAVLFAMYYASVTSLTRKECLEKFHDGKESLLAKYRAGTERALSNADFLCDCDLETLQALTIFLVSLRANDDTMYTWTMVAVAVRLAHSLGLHREGSRSGLSPFVQELRRRLWWQIVMLDVRASEDVSSDPVISEFSFNTKKPLNINDSDMDPESIQPIMERQGFTEMTKANLSHDVSFLAWRLAYVTPVRDNEEGAERTLEDKLKIVADTEEHIQKNVLTHCDPSNSVAWVVSVVAQLIIRRLRLALYHPLQHSSRPSERPQVSREVLLRTAVECMEYSHLLDTEPVAARWRWFFKTYVQWHALAATLTELCVQTKGLLVERAWRIVDVVFDDWANRIADSLNGMLWRPIKKLRNKAQTVRNEAQISSMNLNAQSQQQLPLPYFGNPDGNPDFANHQNPMGYPSLPSPISLLRAQDMQDQLRQASTDPSVNEISVLDADLGVLTTDDPVGSIKWSEWDQFMQDFQMEDQMIQLNTNPATKHELKPVDNWW